MGPGFLLTGFTSLTHPIQPMTWLVRVSKGGHKRDPLDHDLLGIYPRGVQVGHPFLDPFFDPFGGTNQVPWDGPIHARNPW